MGEATETGFGFVNRTNELGFLDGMLPTRDAPASFVIISSPSGFGKSRLTEEWAKRSSRQDLVFVVVDPLFRSASPNLYGGYFLQKCVQALDEVARAEPARGFENFRSFLTRRRWERLRSKRAAESLRRMPSWTTAYELGFEYLERFFVFGRQEPKHLLSSDQADAIAACQAYFDYAARRPGLVIILRQAQYIDHESLRTFLSLNRSTSHGMLLIEYTTADGSLNPEHERFFTRELRGHPNARILQLLRLDQDHLEQLLHQLALPSRVIQAHASGFWNGNVRALEQLEFMATLSAPLGGPDTPQLLEGPPDLTAALLRRIESLGRTEQLLLALVAAHREAVPSAILFLSAHRIAPHATDTGLRRSLDQLVDHERLVHRAGADFALAYDGLGTELLDAVGMKAAVRLGEANLRDIYAEIFRSGSTAAVAHSSALRRALIFSARTGDPQLLVSLIDGVTDEVARANDQGVYVDVIGDAVATLDDPLPSERRRLTAWAAGLAYDICDFRRCRRLLEHAKSSDFKDMIILAHCWIEEGAHANAVRIAQTLRGASGEPRYWLMADLIEGGVALDSGDWATCRERLERIVAADHDDHAPLTGHALRLLSEVRDYPACTETALASVARFETAGLKRCAAYSAVSASRFLAREGRIPEARDLIAQATRTLQRSVRDDHIIRNNRAMVELLAPDPNFSQCVAELQIALRTSRDDFCDLTILTNLALAQAGAGEIGHALDCVGRASAILDDPGFAERDVLWPVCFNLGWVLDKAGDPAAAQDMRARPRATGWTVRSNSVYWAYRYGESSECDPRLGYLHDRPFHPTAISHWQVDLEAVARLSAGSRR